MASIGIDFGTTNSIVAVFQNSEPQLFVPTNQNGTPQIRSALAVDQRAGKSAIGRSALFKRGQSGIDWFDGFKLLIGATDVSRVAAKTFLKSVIDLYIKESGSTDIDSVVLTVPDLWLRDEGQLSYHALRQICSELKLPVKMFLSEPVAAASYSAYRLKESGRPYSGRALVFDHGGGTLDLSVVQIDDTQVTTIDGAGLEPRNDSRGVGGRHYDEAVFEHMARRDPDLKARISDDAYAWLDEFEQRKTALTEDIESCIGAFLESDKAPEFDDPIFDVKSCEVRPSDLVTVYETEFSNKIRNLIKELLERTNITDGEAGTLKIIFSGGFSNYYLNRRLVYEVIGRTGPHDARFDAGYAIGDISFAVAKGASLCAADESQVYETCPVDLSIVLLNNKGVREEFDLLRRGTPLSEVESPKFLDKQLEVVDDRALDEPIELVIRRSGKRNGLSTDFVGRDLIPRRGTAKYWRVGAFVDKDLTVHIAVQPNDEETGFTCQSLGGLISTLSAKESRR